MKTIKVEVSKLEGWQLDWAFAMAKGIDSKNIHLQSDFEGGVRGVMTRGNPWRQFHLKGHITLDFLEREKIETHFNPVTKDWRADISGLGFLFFEFDKSLVNAIAKCYIASKLGDSVDVPVMEGV